MRNELQRHKRSDKVKWVITGIAFVLVFVLIAGLCMQLFGQGKVKPSEWFDKTECVHIDEDEDGICDECGKDMPDNSGDNAEGMVMPSETNGKQMRVTAKLMSPSAYSAYGVSTQAENAYTLTAEVFPDYASDKSLDWSVAWLCADSKFANGKTVTDYVTITPTTDGALTAVCECLQDFGEPVVLTVSSRSNPEVCGFTTVNYYQRIKSLNYSFNYNGEAIEVSADSHGVYKFDYTGAKQDYTVDVVPVYSNYTLTDTYSTTISGSLSSTFGYTATESLNTLKIPAGLSGGDPELSANALNWCQYVGSQVFSFPNMSNDTASYINIGRQLCNGQNVSAFGNILRPEYTLTAEEKTHPRCGYYLSLINNITNFSSNTAYLQAKTNYQNYQPSAYNYYGASIATYSNFVSAAKACNNAGVGVIHYTVKIQGEYSTYETVLKLGYNDEFNVTVSGVNMSDTTVSF